MRYTKKASAAVTVALLGVGMSAGTAFADHGSAYSARGTGAVLQGATGSPSVGGWVFLGAFMLLMVFALAGGRIVAAIRDRFAKDEEPTPRSESPAIAA